MKFAQLLLVIAFWALINGERSSPLITPKPVTMDYGTKTFKIEDCIEISHNSKDDNFASDIIQIYSSMFFSVHTNLSFKSKCSFKIEINMTHPEVMKPEGIDNQFEKYSLEITEEGTAKIDADYRMGAIRAMDTLAQLFDQNDEILQINFLPISIKDQPRYGYRGLMLDVSREFYPVSVLLKLIDGLRMTKVNYLHLHLSDDDSWPVQFPSMPDLSKHTAFTPKEIYKADDIRKIINYAKQRGITVIPEIDVPGHTTAFGSDPALNHIATWLNKVYPWDMPDNGTITGGPPSAVLNPALNQTYDFLAKISGDIFDLFKDSDFYHFGGDEVNTKACWENDPIIQKFMKEHSLNTGVDLFNYFNRELSDMLHNNPNATHKASKTTSKPLVHWTHDKESPITWEKGSILQYWGAAENITMMTNLYPDHKYILSPWDFFYLDWGTGNRYGTSLCNPFQTFAKVRTFEPTNYIKEGDNRVLGGEACMWSELVTPANVFNKVFPKLAVVSEILWSEKIRTPIDWVDVVERLSKFRSLLELNGISTNKITSRACEITAKETFKAYKRYEENENFNIKSKKIFKE